MSVESIGYSEKPSFENTKDLFNINISKIEQDFIRVKEIRKEESSYNEDNKETINIEDLIEETYTNNFNNQEKIQNIKIEEQGLEDNTDVLLGIVKLPVLVLGTFGKYIKGLFQNKNSVNLEKTISKKGVDFIDMKGTYKLDDIKGLKLKDSIGKIQDFSDKIDIKYLTKNPDRLNNMLEIVDGICNYTIKNSSDILKMNRNDFEDYIHGYNTLRKKLNMLKDSPLLKESNKNDLIRLYKNNFTDSYNTIYYLKPNSN